MEYFNSARDSKMRNTMGKSTEKSLIEWLSVLMIVFGFVIATSLLLLKRRASYGRYFEEAKFKKFALDARIGWFIQELPALIIPLIAYLRVDQQNLTKMGSFCALLFIVHYIQRTLIYSFLIRGGKPLPLDLVITAIIFTTWNGYIQGHYHLLYAEYSNSTFAQTIRFIGCLIFLLGLIINLDSDRRLRNLRVNSKDQSYKIPYGGFFKFVSGANFFGEILEWFGYALCCQTLPSLAFCFLVFANTVPRAIEHHKWYLKKFDEYPKDRKAIIPLLL